MRILKVVVVAALLSLVPAAFAADQKNIVRGGLFYSHPTGDFSEAGARFEPDNAIGVQGSYERKLSDLIGINFLAGYVNYDVDVKVGGFSAKFAEQPALPLSANLLFHPIRNKNVDWYIGPGVSYVQYDDADVESRFGGGKVKSSNDTALGVQTGLDIKFGDGVWGLNLDLQYIRTSADDLDVDPINFGVGVAIRF